MKSRSRSKSKNKNRKSENTNNNANVSKAANEAVNSYRIPAEIIDQQTEDLVNDSSPETSSKYPEYIFLTGRVHPGETSASWVLQGSLNFLLSDDFRAEYLRKKYVFKIIPMLNPDGVVVGNHRCSLIGYDLNRQYKGGLNKTQEGFMPEIFWTKALLYYSKSGRRFRP